jgi:hypothetical protein
LAETYACRGLQTFAEGAKKRTPSRTATHAEASSFLDAALRLEKYRAPRLRCVHEAPLPVPLTFPKVFPGSPPPLSAAATARLRSGAAHGRVLAGIRENWIRAARAAAGKAALRAWGVEDDEIQEVAERALEMKRGYDDDDDDDRGESEDELDQM